MKLSQFHVVSAEPTDKNEKLHISRALSPRRRGSIYLRGFWIEVFAYLLPARE